MRNPLVDHYNSLIDENNDPVHDPAPLQEYMNKWDGDRFIEDLRLSCEKSVLEIGVGTGRLAVRAAPDCGRFVGIDISPKTIERACENLAEHKKVELICDDFLTHEFDGSFEVIYSSLTFMHIEDKHAAVNKVAALLNLDGRFVLSIDKNQDEYIVTGDRKLQIFPDKPGEILSFIKDAGLIIVKQYDTEFAHIFVAEKKSEASLS